ncbi:MAG TPA: carboxypeptidase-like regulatory domain-containing protein [Pyrinomonadaceae bacterium]|nr:carboxypeptidase-like regulatory domain-containing protein [Pyrinomonadaceae bacterium]
MSTNTKSRRALFALFRAALLAPLVALSAPEAAARQAEVEVEVEAATEAAKEEEPKSSVYGKAVYDGTGRPVRRARVVLLPHSPDSRATERSGLTDGEGQFRITKVPRGRYFVAVDVKGVLSPMSFLDIEQANKSRRPDMTQVGDNFETVEIDGKADKEITVRARRGGAIGGRVTYSDGEPAVNIIVHLMRVKDGRPVPFLNGLGAGAIFGMRTDDRGVYRVSGLPAGEYVVGVAEAVEHADGEGDASRYSYGAEFGAMGSPFGLSFHPKAVRPEDAEVVRVRAGEEIEGVDVTIADREARVIAGTVRGKRDKAPVAGATVTFRSKDGGMTIVALMYNAGGSQSVSTDEQGRWQFKELPDGVYVVSARPPSQYEPEVELDEALGGGDGEQGQQQLRPARPSVPKKKKLTPKEQEVRVSGGDVRDVVIELSEGATISGTTVFEGGFNEGENVNIYALRADGVPGEEPAVSSSDSPSDGKFLIEGVPPGKVHLRFNQFGPTVKDRYIKSMTWRGKDLLREPLEVAEGAEVDGVRIVFSTDVATLDVRAVTAKGKLPAAGVNVTVVPTDPVKWPRPDAQASCVTDDAGRCTLTTAPDEYFVMFTDGLGALAEAEIRERAAAAPRLKLAGGEKRGFELVVPGQ